MGALSRGYVPDVVFDIGAADGNVVAQNDISNSALDGIFVNFGSGPNLIERNTSNRNGRHGINIGPAGMTVTQNTTWFNAQLGISAIFGAIDGGGNSAKHNGDTDECSPAISC